MFGMTLLEIAALGAVGLASAAGTVALLLRVAKFGTTYPDFIVGQLAWIDGSKTQDLLCIPAALVIAALAIVGTRAASTRLAQPADANALDEFHSALLLWTLPTLAGLGLYSLAQRPLATPFLISPVAHLVIVAVAARAQVNGRPTDVGACSIALVGVLFASFLPLEASLVARHLGGASERVVSAFRIAIPVATLGALAGFVTLALRAAPRRDVVRLAAFAQLGAPLLYLAMLPVRMTRPDGTEFHYHNGIGLVVCVMMLIALAYAEIFLGARRSHASGWKDFAFSPTALFAFVVAVRASMTLSPEISPDDYHFGERLLGGWRLLAFGELPYVENFPPHGFVEDDLASVVSFLFYDGRAASISEASRVVFIVLAFVAFRSVLASTKSTLFAFVFALFLGGRLAWWFFTPFACAWIVAYGKMSPLRWLTVWACTAPIAVLGIPPQGVLLVAATSPMAVASLRSAYRENKPQLLRALGAYLVVVLLVAAITPLVPMAIGACRYVLLNGAVNQVAYGIPWWASRNANPSGLSFELLRLSFVLAPALALGLAWAYRKDPTTCLPALAVLGFTLLMIPYAMGRIDPGNPSRPGVVSSWAVLFFVPVLAQRVVASARFPLVVLAAATLGSCLGTYAPGTTPIELASQNTLLEMNRALPELRDVDAARLHNVGDAVLDSAHFERLSALARVLDEHDRPGRGYLDLTNRNAQYFYLGRRPLLAVTAPFNMVPAAQQRDAIVALERTRPRVALLSADNILHDGGSLALRTHSIFRYTIMHYLPFVDGPFVLGLRERASGSQRSGIEARTDGVWKAGVHRTDCGFVISDALLARSVREGDLLRFDTGETRHVSGPATDAQVVLCTGEPLDPARVGWPRNVEVVLGRERRDAHARALLDATWATRDLGLVPSAWGRSEASLRDRMRTVVDFAQSAARTVSVDLTRAGGVWEIAGERPSVTFELGGLLAGRDAGLLRFDFRCHGRREAPRIEISYRGRDEQAFVPEQSFYVAGEDGTQIIPLDAYPSWLLSGSLGAVRISLANPGACDAVSIDGARLAQRR